MGKGAKDSGKQSRKVLQQTTAEIRAATRPSREAYFSQLNDVLKTGGNTTNVPVLNTALEGLKFGQDRTIATANESINRAGLGNTPFAQSLRTGLAVQGGQAQSATRDKIFRQFFEQAPSASLGQTAQATQALQGVAARGAQGQIAGQQSQQQLIGAGAAAGGAVIGAVIIAI
jgi:hypothetical protein